MTEAQEPVFLPAIALSPDCSRTLTPATLKLLSEKMKENEIDLLIFHIPTQKTVGHKTWTQFFKRQLALTLR